MKTIAVITFVVTVGMFAAAAIAHIKGTKGDSSSKHRPWDR